MKIDQLWRYPVKSMAGERLMQAQIGADGGIVGDRTLLVVDPHGRLITSRSRPKLLGHKASLGTDNEVLIDGRPWQSPEVARDIEKAAGPGCKLFAHDGPERFDILPLLVGTDGGLAAFGRDVRRLRPNVLVGGIEGWIEADWQGKCLRIGPVVILMRDLRPRCVMTTFDPDSLAQDVNVLRDIVRRFHGCLFLNSVGLSEGRIEVGDPVELLEVRTEAELEALLQRVKPS
jgi:uncharacterized protein